MRRHVATRDAHFARAVECDPSRGPSQWNENPEGPNNLEPNLSDLSHNSAIVGHFFKREIPLESKLYFRTGSEPGFFSFCMNMT